MRRLLTFTCDGAELGASLDGDGRTGLLFVTGGGQIRAGSHRLFERLARELAREGHACFRFDRRGVGDSGGADPGFRGSGPDIAAAAAAFRAHHPGLDRVIGIGLCDGATALMLFGAEAGLDGLILLNPWLVEAEADAPPPAAIRSHYLKRLTSLDGWKKLLSGSISYGKLLKGVAKAASSGSSPLAADAARALALPAVPILATGDATAIAAARELRDPAFERFVQPPIALATDSHTFARPGDHAGLRQAIGEALRQLGG
ncbi:MAG: hydrolase 1, exosortase A system-associated [Allosphingosinicella sp.]|uniref:hydrolase 1, exosortase A system-associated n=1 Tax=Allosphingosinicella sp. TaxID=2823234 RepID=UPI0039433A3A